MEKNDNKIVIALPTLISIHERLEKIERKIDDLTSLIERFDTSKHPAPEKKMMTLKEVSEVYGMSLATLRRKAAMRDIPLVKLGGRIYVNVSDFDEWLSEKRIPVYR